MFHKELEEIAEFLRGHGWSVFADCLVSKHASLQAAAALLEDSGYKRAAHEARLLNRRVEKAT